MNSCHKFALALCAIANARAASPDGDLYGENCTCAGRSSVVMLANVLLAFGVE